MPAMHCGEMHAAILCKLELLHNAGLLYILNPNPVSILVLRKQNLYPNACLKISHRLLFFFNFGIQTADLCTMFL